MSARLFTIWMCALPLGCSDAIVPTVGPRLEAIADASVPMSDATPDAPDAPDAGGVSFARDIRPLMNRSGTDPTGHGCKRCHYPSVPPAGGFVNSGLDLETLGKLRLGGKTSGARIVVPGKPEESALVQKLRGTYAFGARMPKDGPAFWSEEQIVLVERWIREGAKGADNE
ncbi:MAG: hypothetical protein HYV09_09680 [Deltaproteobacteria bacterium]|nr:hypothetical protein [Deltaproteobacteria bacterium]